MRTLDAHIVRQTRLTHCMCGDERSLLVIRAYPWTIDLDPGTQAHRYLGLLLLAGCDPANAHSRDCAGSVDHDARPIHRGATGKAESREVCAELPGTSRARQNDVWLEAWSQTMGRGRLGRPTLTREDGSIIIAMIYICWKSFEINNKQSRR